MKSSILFPLSTTLPFLCDALSLIKRDNPAVIAAPIQRNQNASSVQHDRARFQHKLKRQSNTVTASLTNEITLYFASVSVGTPSQTVLLHIDTGSSDLWVNAPNSTLCEQYAQDCDSVGVYDAAASSTYAFVNNEFNITYADGSGAVGIYATDDVGIGGVTLDNLQFGIGYTSTSATGILGIGYAANEALVEYSDTYVNMPLALVNAGHINTNAYSLWLDDLEASTGSILFGGVNAAKYSGSLETVPVLAQSGVYAAFYVTLSGIGRNNDNSSLYSTPIAALLDSGTSLTYLPNSVVQTLYEQYSANYDSSYGYATIDCSYADSSDTIDYTFSGKVISVPLSELVLVEGSSNGQQDCIFGISPAGEGTGSITVLGDTFLRSAYVVYDLSNNEISLAQTNFNPGSDDILEITSNSVPGAVAVSTTATASTSIPTDASAGGIDLSPSVASAASPVSTGMASAMAAPALGVYGALAIAGLAASFAF